MSTTTSPQAFDANETLDLIERDYRDAPELIRNNMLERIQQLRSELNTPAAREGSEVSVDVSTCDEDAERRVFATIKGSQEDPEALGGRIWLAHMDEDNFELIGKDGAQSAAEQSDEDDETVCLIWFEDADAAPEIITNRAVAERRFEMISSSWNAHLFAKLKSNDPNDPFAGGNIKEAGAEYAITPDTDNASQLSLSKDLEPPQPIIPEGWTIESTDSGITVLWPGTRGGVHIRTDHPDNSIAGDVLHDLAYALLHPAQHQKSFQQRVEPWLLQCFGEAIANDGKERNDRFLEESLELVQSLGYSAHEAHQLVDYVFGRDVGHPPQEVGGVMVTLAGLCRAHLLDMHECGEVELERVWGLVEKIRAKQAAKPVHSPLPE